MSHTRLILVVSLFFFSFLQIVKGRERESVRSNNKKIGQEFFPAHRFELFWRRYREWETKRLRGGKTE